MPELNIDPLKRLCETPGIAGQEDAVRRLVREGFLRISLDE